MNNIINSILNWLKAHPLVTVVGSGFILVFLVLTLAYYGSTLTNRISSWWYSRGTEQAHEKIEKAKGEAAQAKAVAEEALRELAKEKERGEAERKKRELAEQILSDRSKTTNEKLEAYEKAINQLPTVSGPTSVDELCARARAAGIACE